MKFVIYSVVVLFIATVIAIFAKEDPGYVMFTIRGITIETSVIVFGVAVLLVVAALYMGLRLLIATGLMPRRFRRWRSNRGQCVSRKSLADGIVKLNLGQWHKAEKLFIKAAHSDDLAPIAYLSAARAAQGQGIPERRDGYLQLAQAKSPKASTAMSIALAQLQADDGDTEKAIKTLNKLPVNDRNQPQALKLLSRCYRTTNNWPALVELLPRLRGNKVLPQIKYYELEHSAYSGFLNHTARTSDGQALIELWEKLPKQLYDKEDMIADYCCSLIHFGQSNEAEEILYRRINKSWSEPLVYLYGLLDGDAEIHFSRAKNWYKKHQDNAILLLTMGRLAMRSHQWEEARKLLENSLQITPNSDTYQELGNLLSFQNEQGPALECYRRSLALNTANPIIPELKSGSVIKARLPKSTPDNDALTTTQLATA
ncbi:heme biosynthesis HemY N-terminal domain-containing protein [Pseudomonadota bacterium]